MMLRDRSLLKLHDWTPEEIRGVLDLAADLKRRKKAGERGQRLIGKSIALVFEKMSTRTRCAAAVAAFDEGAHAEYLAAGEIHLGKKESVRDTARVLGRMFDGILFRGYRQKTAETLAQYAGVPVWNGLTNEWHPTQVLADLMTLREHWGRLEGRKLVYVGDGRNNVANTLMIGCAMMGMRFVNCTPRELRPREDWVREAQSIAARTGGDVAWEEHPREAVRGADALYTDVWVSMGEEDEAAERVRLLRPYQVNPALLEATGRAGQGDLLFLHCLPALHNEETEAARRLGVTEVTDEVFEGPYSKVFDQAENRVHTIKAVFVATLT